MSDYKLDPVSEVYLLLLYATKADLADDSVKDIPYNDIKLWNNRQLIEAKEWALAIRKDKTIEMPDFIKQYY